MPLTLPELETEISRRAKIVGASGNLLPSYGRTRDFGYPHIEVNDLGYHYIVTERGNELKHLTTPDLDELLYYVFQSIAFSLASHYEASHRIKNQDSRRQLFQRQLDLLAKLSPAWAERCATEQANILKENPFND